MRLSSLILLGLAISGCREERAGGVSPGLRVAPEADLGFVKVGGSEQRALTLEASTKTQLVIDGARVEGGGSAFTLDFVPKGIAALGSATLLVRFSPQTAGVHTATLVIESDDAEAPQRQVKLTGRGALPTADIFVRCEGACASSVDGTAITFPSEPLARLRPVDVATLPRLVVRATGEVPVAVTELTLTGEAFHFVGNVHVPVGGLNVAAGTEQSVALVFAPTDATKLIYTGALDISTDATDTPTAQFTLHGTVRENVAPTVCAGVTHVTPVGGTTHAVNFSSPGLVPPRAEVTLSAFSSPDDTTCTFDADDGRAGLTYEWALTQQPTGGDVTLADATGPTPRLRPVLPGQYRATLQVRDVQGHSTTAQVAFNVGHNAQLLLELYPTTSQADLDLHLVRPGSSPFAPGDDLSGVTLLSGQYSLDWGTTGGDGDPWLLFDNTGPGQPQESIFIERPECEGAACTFGVYVHSFRARAPVGTPPSCDVSAACLDGAPCTCGADYACVAQVAPLDAGTTGDGRCLSPSSGVLRVTLFGQLDRELPVKVLSPCHLVHVADVTWPQPGSDAGVTVTEANGVERYGQRLDGSLECAPPWLWQPR